MKDNQKILDRRKYVENKRRVQKKEKKLVEFSTKRLSPPLVKKNKKNKK